MPKAISAIVTVGSASSASCLSSQLVTEGSGDLRRVSETTLVSRKIKVRAPVYASRTSDHRLEIDIRAAVPCQPSIERSCGLAPGFVDFVCLQCALHDIGDRPVFAACETMGEIPSLGAANGQLGFGHDNLH